MSPRLPVRLSPQHDETLHAFVLRLSAANAYRLSMLTEAALLPPSFATRPCDLRRLAAMIQRPAEELEAIACWPSGADGRIRFGSRMVTSGMLELQRPRICRACMAARTRVEPLWDCLLVTACETHGTALVDACPRCARPLTWRRPAPDRCTCGASLAGDPDPAGAEALLIAGAARAYLDGRTPSRGQCGPALASLDAFLRLSWFVGTLAVAPGPEWRQLYISRPRLDTTSAIAASAAACLARWPAGLPDWLQAVSFAPGPAAGSFTARLRSALGDPEFTPFVDGVRRLLADHPDGPVRRWAFLFEQRERKWVAGADAARRLRVGQASVPRLLRQGLLDGTATPVGSRRRLRISAGSLRRLEQRMVGAIGAPEAATRFGVSRRTLLRLVRGGLIGDEAPRIRCRYEECDIDALAARLDARLDVRSAAPPPEETLTLAHVGRSRHLNLADVLEAVLAGRMPLFASEIGEGALLDRYRVRREDVRGRSLQGGKVAVDVRRAARALGVSTRMVPILVRTGCLVAAGDRARDGRRLPSRSVDAASVEDFHQRFIMARTLAARHRTSTRSVGRALASAGLRPVVRSESRRGISAVWRASDVAPLDVQRLLTSTRRAADVAR